MLLHGAVLGVQRQQHLHLVKLALLRVGGGGGERHQRQRRALLGVLRARGGGGHGAGLHALRHGFALCRSVSVPLTHVRRQPEEGKASVNPKKARKSVPRIETKKRDAVLPPAPPNHRPINHRADADSTDRSPTSQLGVVVRVLSTPRCSFRTRGRAPGRS